MASNKKEFLPQLETMDLRSIHDETFVVAVSTGPRDESGLLGSTLKGPFDFGEMISEVGNMWKHDQNNAKVFILSKENKARWLDTDTIDYIQYKYADIIMNKIMGKEEEYSCKVKIIG